MRQRENSNCKKYGIDKIMLGVVLIFLILCYREVAYASEGEEKNVLFISSYSENFITVPDQIKGIQSVFQTKNVNLSIEYMDTKKYCSEENIRNFYTGLKYKLENGDKYDAVIVGDDAALQFAMDYQEELFFKIPIIFFGINDKERAETANRNPYMAGSIEETSLVENIKIATDFNPKAKKVAAIVDGTLTGQGDWKQFEAASKFFQGYEFQKFNVSDYSFEEFGTLLESLGEDTIVLFQDMNQDNSGTYMDLNQQIEFIKNHTNVPVYRASIGGVGEGLMGGKMISYEKFGAIAADMVMDIFDGKKVESMKLLTETPYYYCFDYDIIQKYNIDKSLIPKDAVLLHKEVHPLEKYRNYILAAGIFILFLILFALILIFDNVKRRKMQKELQESNERLTAIYEELAASEEELQTQYDIVEKNAKEVNLLYEKYDIAIKSTNSAVWELNLNTKEVDISKNFEDIVKRPFRRPENIYKIVETFIHSDYVEKLITEVSNHVKGAIEEINIQVPTSDENNRKWILIRGKVITDNTENVKKIYGIFLDVTALKQQEAYIDYIATHDYLTSLPNRMKFMEVLHSELKRGARGAVLLFDIDDFKSINDTLGHIYGDELLKKAAERLNDIRDPRMFVARLGGDEFLILLREVSTYEEVRYYVRKIEEAFSENFMLEGIENYISFSMGITLYPKDSDDINQLIMNADTAMYQVKHNGKNNCIYYHEGMKEEMKAKKEIDVILRHALKENGLCLYYQPQIEAETGNVIGFEALLRLCDNSISPKVFIPIAEETGQIIDIGRWVAREAIRQAAEWREKGLEEKVIAINYSGKQLRDKGYIEYVRQLLKEYHVKAGNIEIEITEGILLENNVQTIEFLEELKKYGFGIALDDFGTGYSSLNYLTYIPVDKVKLDKSINDKFLSLENSLVMDSLISLAHSLNLKITAEGIEEWDKFIKLKNSHCDYIQGYLFSKPLNKDEIEKVYNKNFLLHQKLV